jgi:uncharacterized lipoprotein YajG
MNFRIVLSLSCLLLLGGCATGRSVLDIPLPASKAASASVGKEVLITSVSDKRIFEVRPRHPNIPSLDPSENQSTTIKARAIGRKRDNWGKARGDVLLKEGQTVETLTTALIRQAFAEKGYKLIDSKEQATNNTVFVEAAIDKFWFWIKPIFTLGLTLSTEITTDISIKSAGKDTTTTVSVNATSDNKLGDDEDWFEFINKTLRAYEDELKTKLE